MAGARLQQFVSPSVPPALIAGPKIQSPDPTVNRVPLALDFTPRWQIAHDLATGTVTVTTGERPILLTPSRDGRVELNHTATASVTAARPDAARVEGETTITLQTPSGSTVVIATRSWVTQTGMTLSGRVVVDGHIFFDKQWQK